MIYWLIYLSKLIDSDLIFYLSIKVRRTNNLDISTIHYDFIK